MKTPNYSGDPNDKTDDTPFDGLREKSLKTAGYAYLVGDAALFASGRMAGRNKEANAGLVYTIGGLACARYANPTAEKQMKLLGTRMGEFLRKEGAVIPKDPDIQNLLQPGGVIDHVESFLYKYPSQVLNATYAAGGVQLLRSGLQAGKHWDTASGALVAAGGLAGLLIHEQPKDKDHPPKTAFAKAVAWLQEKPLRLSGGLYMLNNATLIMSALEERKANPAQKSYMFKFLTAASYIFGNTMLSLSSKENKANGEQCNEAMDKLSQASAKIIAAQPQELQEALVQHIAGFLASQPEVTMKADAIADLLHGKLRSVGMPAMGDWSARHGIPGLQPLQRF